MIPVLASGQSWKAARICKEKKGHEIEASEEQTKSHSRLAGCKNTERPAETHTNSECAWEAAKQRLSWNACCLLGLESGLGFRVKPEPYFITTTLGSGNQYLNGILGYDIASGTFRWKPQDYIIHQHHQSKSKVFHVPSEVKGVTPCLHKDEAEDKYGVFNIHSKV